MEWSRSPRSSLLQLPPPPPLLTVVVVVVVSFVQHPPSAGECAERAVQQEGLLDELANDDFLKNWASVFGGGVGLTVLSYGSVPWTRKPFLTSESMGLGEKLAR